MKRILCHRRKQGLTLVELLVVMAVIAIYAAMIFSGASFSNAKPRAMRIQCVNNLKQIGLATRVWEGDHGDKLPWAVSGTNVGTMEFVSGLDTWRHFQTLSNELSLPKVLLCPSDGLRQFPATNFNFLNNSNLSYFIGMDVSETNPDGVLSGDRNLTNGMPVENGILELIPNRPPGWTDEIHHKVGNVVLSDGSVQQVSSFGLREAFVNSHNPTNRLLMPVLAP